MKSKYEIIRRRFIILLCIAIAGWVFLLVALFTGCATCKEVTGETYWYNHVVYPKRAR